ncbi:MAG: acetate/propionate family kinase [Gemmataceae bacterium]
MSILVINSGSSSLKFAAFETPSLDTLASGKIQWRGDHVEGTSTLEFGDTKRVKQVSISGYEHAVRYALESLEAEHIINSDQPIEAVGHRIVHGGSLFPKSVYIDSSAKDGIRKLANFAPLHNPPALEAIEAIEKVLREVPNVAVFDTSFHATIGPEAHVYPLPYEWYEQRQVRRYGFHGISVDYCTRRSAELLDRPASELRLVVCHLGNGCSATAVQHGKSVATTMGFTPLEGLMMGTRCGSVDPSVVVHMQTQAGFSPQEVERVMNHESGLLGISGVSSDFREVDAASREGNARAKLAIDIYADRIRMAIGAAVVKMGGVDALIFTAGVGEHSAPLREMVCQGLDCIGIQLDSQANSECQPDVNVATKNSPAKILVLHTREELLIAKETHALLIDLSS